MCKTKHLQNVLEPATSRGYAVDVGVVKCFILHVTTSKNALATLRILQKHFSRLVLVAEY